MIGIVLVDAFVWFAWSLVASTIWRTRRPTFFDRDTWVTKPRRWEKDGRRYEALRIRRWKDALPEFGGFAGGRSKRALGGTDHAALAAFARETRRAEYVHWTIAAAGPFFAIWNPPLLTAAMLAYAAAANVPFIAIQRYNRLRILRIQRRRARSAS